MTWTKSLIATPFLTALERGLSRVALWLGLGAMALLSACGGGSGGGAVDIVDTSVPTLVMSSNAPATASAPFIVTFTFSAPITIYSTDGVLPWATSQGATPDKSTFTKVSATQYTVTVNPNNLTKTDKWTLTLPAGAYKNAANNAFSTVVTTLTQAIDTSFPIASFSPKAPPIGVNFTGPTTVTVAFNTQLTADLTAGQLVLSAINLDTQLDQATPGTISNFVKTSGPLEFSAYSFLYTPVSGSNSVKIRIPAGSVSAGGFSNTGDQWGAMWFLVP
jgi:hypothetical protein